MPKFRGRFSFSKKLKERVRREAGRLRPNKQLRVNGNKDDTLAGLACQKWPKKGGVSKQLRWSGVSVHTQRKGHCRTCALVLVGRSASRWWLRNYSVHSQVSRSPLPPALPVSHKGPRHHPLAPPAGTCSSRFSHQAAEGNVGPTLPAASAPEPPHPCLHLGCGQASISLLPPL